ncbi:MAG: hypothetical protein IJS65_03085, partial [Clostridia bacterium]|nr:hypothetical protein [Clostridia bacterium]
MKKMLALILAALMLLSLFAACGEKTPEPAGDPSASAPADEETTSPSGENDEEDTDKETTEITAPDAPVIITTDPAPASDGGQQTSQPSGQQTEPQQPASQTPATQTPQSETPSSASQPQQGTSTPASSTLKGLVPASGKLENPKDWKEEHTVLFFGDGFITANQMGDMFKKFAEADGIKINDPSNFTVNTIATDTTYNVYNLFKFDGDQADSKLLAPSNNWIVNSLKEIERYNYDIFICEVSRDRSLATASGRGRNLTAMEYYTKELNKIHPGFKTVHLAPAGFLPDNDGALVKRIGMTYTDFESHNAEIRKYTKEVESRTAGAQSTVLICDAFEYFMKNYASADIDLYDQSRIYPSMAGSYYIACVLYSSVFGNATSGMDFYGYITDHDACKTLQEAADKYVTSTGKALKPHTKNYSSRSFIRPLTLEQADPRNQPQKPEFAHEVYPEYYDELLCSAFAYYQRMNLVQYDNNGMNSSNQNAHREHR